MNFDPRITAARPDLAAEHLKGTVAAEHYSVGRAVRIATEAAPLRATPDAGAPRISEALFGENAIVYDETDGWAWVQLETDHYVGWLLVDVLSAPLAKITHRVKVARTLVFPDKSIKLPPLAALPLGARVSVTSSVEDGFAELRSGGYAIARHLSAAGAEWAHDPVDVAGWFLQAPYLWGGRTALGLDCSGLVQAAFHACGIKCPRDSDQQEAVLGEPVMGWRPQTLARNDLVFWKGHVALARGDGTLIHANAFHMQVAIEDAATCIARIAAGGSEVTSVQRLRKK
jgi:cell wall-associated NlpC family hydrolase